MPVIIGTLPGIPSELPEKGNKKGFQDEVNGNYPKYTETDVNRLAVGDDDLPHSTLTIRQADRTEDIGRADFNEDENFIVNIPNIDKVLLSADDGTNFSEPATPYDATYPYNHVYESEGGHIREMDDTPTKERIHERHSSGSGYEIGPDGTKVTRVKKDNYNLVTGDDFAHIKGNQSTTVDGGVRVFVNANASTTASHYTIQVGKNAHVNIQVDDGDVNVITSTGDINLKSGNNLNIQAAQGIRMQSQTVDIGVAGQWTETTKNKTENTTTHIMNANLQDINGKTEVDIDGAVINLN
jgi:hypothetical protein